MEKITSKEIARLAGVSVSTVSIVLNNKPGVGPETRQHVMQILTSHGIFPKTNPTGGSARGVLRFCKIVKHGHIINDRHNVFISEYIDGVVEEAKKYDFSVEVSTYHDVSIESVVLDLVRDTDLMGCILLSTELSEDDIALFSTLSVPHVFLDALYQYSQGSFVTMDNQAMVFLALKYLKECGHTRIGMLNSFGCSNFSCRRVAFEDSIKLLGLDFEEDQVYSVQSTHLDSYEDMKRLLSGKKLSQLPTAFFACNDIVAFGAVRALQALGFEVPHDISVLGFDDLPHSSLISPALTTMSVPKGAIGRLAVRVLMDKDRVNSRVHSQKYVLGGELVVRSSVQRLQ